MFGILWFTLWATVGEAFYDDYRFTTGDGTIDRIITEWRRYVSGNFSYSLRKQSVKYQDAGDGMSVPKVKAMLRTLKFFEYTGSSNDFDASQGRVLPLPEGAKYCTMGKHTKVDCNYCTCVAGQLYMCTGMICPQSEGVYMALRNDKCEEGNAIKLDCNQCVCHDGKYLCTQMKCIASLRDNKPYGPSSPFPACKNNWSFQSGCKLCICKDKRVLTCIKNYFCQEKKEDIIELWNSTPSKCKEGAKRQIDKCNFCVCVNGQELCTLRGCYLLNPDKPGKYFSACKTSWAFKSRCSFCICQDKYILGCIRNYFCNQEEEDNKFQIHSHVYVLRSVECQEGSVRNFDCNQCICLNGVYACTKMKCGASLEKDQKYNSEDSSLRSEECEEGTKRRIGCNQCTCLSGKEYCTQLECTTKNTETNIKGLRSRKCREGTRHRKGCNRCLCYNGEVYCTTKKCRKKSKKNNINGQYSTHGIQSIGSDCDDGVTVNMGCRICTCRRREWHCTSECVLGERTLYSATCTEGTKRKIDPCNYCLCRNGEEICTNRFCEETDVDHLRQQYQCESGAIKYDKCNLCECHANQWLCTLKNCVDKTLLKHEKKAKKQSFDKFFKPAKCKEGKMKILDSCNRCFCQFGRWFCQKKKCDDNQRMKNSKINELMKNKGIYHNFGDHEIGDTPILRLNRECVIGSRARLNACNYCYCNYYRQYVCSNHSCPQYNALRTNEADLLTHLETNSSVYQCEVGTRKNIDSCNYCLCDDNQKWKCTNSSCLSELKNDLPSSEPQCIEGELRKIDSCNYCTCHDGQEYCTQRGCEPHINQQRTNENCVEGDTHDLDDGCNYCVCRGGQEFCTARACLTKDSSSKESSGGCTEGEVTDAKDNCNLCVCFRGKIQCTNKDCDEMGQNSNDSENPSSYERQRNKKRGSKFKHFKMNELPRPVCGPGPSYLPDYYDPKCPNDCICDKEELLCTRRKCNKRGEVIVESLGSWIPKTVKYRNEKQFLKQENCIENEVLPSDDPCNMCLCLDGRKVCAIVPCSNKIQSRFAVMEETQVVTAKAAEEDRKREKLKKNVQFCEPFTFFSPDNNRFCRNCFCLHNGLALCLLNLCKYSKDIPHQLPHEELTDECKPGEKGYPTKCVSCTCSNDGHWVCTREELKLCQERDCDEKDEFQMGFYPYCAGCKCSSNEWYCAIQSETCQDYSDAKCPMGMLIHNPNQHCSLCLCGGYGDEAYNMCFTEAKCVRQVLSHLKK